jgi:alpha-mannosidase
VVALGPLALLTKGVPEYEARQGGDATGDELCLTLLRCVGVISKPTGAIATRPLGAGPGVPTPEGQCLGRHELEYALLWGADDLGDLELLRESQDYRCGFLVFEGTASRLEAPLALEGDVVFSCLKGAQDGDGLILRCFNPAGSPATGRVLASSGLDGELSVARTRLDETGEEHLPDGVFGLDPGQIATLRLRRK